MRHANLELVERARNHILRVGLFDSREVQQHVVAEMEGGVERIGGSLGVGKGK